MDRSTVLTQLQDICRSVFDDNEIQLTVETTASDVDGWDSLSHVQLILRVERTFGIRISVAEAVSLRNVGELVGLVCRKTKLAA